MPYHYSGALRKPEDRQDPHDPQVWWWYRYDLGLYVFTRANGWEKYCHVPDHTPERIALWVSMRLGAL